MQIGGIVNSAVSEASSKGQGIGIVADKTYEAVVSKTEGNTVTLKLPNGEEVKGELQSDLPLKEGMNIKFQMSGISNGKIQLKIVQNENPIDSQIKNTLQSLNIPTTEKNLQIANLLVKNGLPVNKENMNTVQQLLAQNKGATAQEVVFLLGAKMDVNPSNLQQLRDFLNSTNTLPKQWNTLISDIMKSLPSELKAQLAEVVAKLEILLPSLVKEGASLTNSTNQPMVEPKIRGEHTEGGQGFVENKNNPTNRTIENHVVDKNLKGAIEASTTTSTIKEILPLLKGENMAHGGIVETNVNTTSEKVVSNSEKNLLGMGIQDETIQGGSPGEKLIPVENGKVSINSIVNKELGAEKILEGLLKKFGEVKLDLLTEKNGVQQLKEMIEKEILALHNIKSSLASQKENPVVQKVLQQIDVMETKIQFSNQLNNAHQWVPIPFTVAGKQYEGELFIMNQNKGKKLDGNQVTAFVSLSTLHLGKVDALVQKSFKQITVLFTVEEHTEKILKKSMIQLQNQLKAIGYELTSTTFQKPKEASNTITKLEGKVNIEGFDWRV